MLAVMQAFGRAGIREMVERHCACARQLAQRLAAVPGIQVMNEVSLNQVALSFDLPGNDRASLTDEVVEEIQRENRSFVSGADWRGRRIMRVSVIARGTDSTDITDLADSIVRAWTRVSTRNSANRSLAPST